jgi:hypothetical protein
MSDCFVWWRVMKQRGRNVAAMASVMAAVALAGCKSQSLGGPSRGGKARAGWRAVDRSEIIGRSDMEMAHQAKKPRFVLPVPTKRDAPVEVGVASTRVVCGL